MLFDATKTCVLGAAAPATFRPCRTFFGLERLQARLIPPTQQPQGSLPLRGRHIRPVIHPPRRAIPVNYQRSQLSQLDGRTPAANVQGDGLTLTRRRQRRAFLLLSSGPLLLLLALALARLVVKLVTEDGRVESPTR